MPSDLLLDAYLARIGYSGPRSPSREALRALHESHVGSIPFENLDLLLGKGVALDLAALQAKLVAGRRGGYCFEHNTLFRAALEPQYPVDFEMANHFTSTYPSSPFLQNLVVQRSWPERRAILRNRELVMREGGAAEATTIRDPEHLLEVLERVFGLRFPPGTRFAQPSFS